MTKTIKLIFLASVLTFGAGCISSKARPQLDNTFIGQPLEHYSGPKAKVTLTDFEIKTPAATKDEGVALREAFLSVLEGSGRFTVVPAQEADLVINVAVVEFNPEAAGGKLGLGGGGSAGSSFMGGLLGVSLNRASMGLDLRIIERASSKVINKRVIRSLSTETPATKDKELSKKLVLRNGLSRYKDGPMGKVIQDGIVESARYLAQNIPLEYYKY